MSYKRVVPRDLFNEAGLLKAIGKLVLLVEDGKAPWLSYHHDGEAFNIAQNPSNGAIYVANVQFFAANAMLSFERPLNSREPWALYLEMEHGSYDVFDENVNLLVTLDQIWGLL